MKKQRTAVAIRHVTFEDLGLMAPVLDAENWQTSVLDAAVDDLTDPSLAKADLLIVLGGPIGAYETDIYPFLVTEIRLLEQRLRAGSPLLGICLGCQLMAQALGARVFSGGRKEIGWGHVSLTEDGEKSALAPLASPEAKVLHWHGDTFDLPSGTTRLAGNDVYQNQAFTYGTHALALQFHVEAEPRKLENWFVGHAAELSSNGISIPALRADTARYQAEVEAQARTIFSAWLKSL